MFWKKFKTKMKEEISNQCMANRGSHLFDKIDAWLKIHSEINKCPRNMFAFIFFLFQYKHGMIEVLLEAFVREIYA